VVTEAAYFDEGYDTALERIESGRTSHGKSFNLTDLCGESGPWERGLHLHAAEIYAQSCINRYIPYLERLST